MDFRKLFKTSFMQGQVLVGKKDMEHKVSHLSSVPPGGCPTRIIYVQIYSLFDPFLFPSGFKLYLFFRKLIFESSKYFCSLSWPVSVAPPDPFEWLPVLSVFGFGFLGFCTIAVMLQNSLWGNLAA